MFGWEFPPRISGGLGTACQGITLGLARAGVDVSFVLPRLFGDEAGGDARFLGAENFAGAEPTHWLEVDSLLAPYLDEATYAGRLRSTRARRAGSSAARRVPMVFDPSGGRAVVARRGHVGADLYGPDLFSEVARYARAGGEIARTRPFDVVHAHDWMTVPAGIEASRVANKPLVLHMHASEHDRNRGAPDPRIEEVEQRGLEAAHRVVTVSRYAARVLQRHYRLDPAKVRVVHNAILPRPDAARPRAGPPGRRPVVLFLGRITSQKGPGTFLDAAVRVLREAPGTRFVMAGSGDLLPQMVERSARSSLARRIHFTGFLGGDDVSRAYRMADLFVLPSVSEPFGIAPLEALAHGVPVIVSRRSGVAEVLPSAIQVPAGNGAALARAILSVLRDPARGRRLARQGRREARRLSWERQGSLLRRVYEEVVR